MRLSCLILLGISHHLLTINIHPSIHSTHSRRNLLALTLIARIHCIRRARKRLLNWRPWLGRDIQFRKLRPDLEDVHARSVEDLLRWRDCYSEVCVFGEARDEEHESAGFDLHFGEVGAASWDVGVSSAKKYVSECQVDVEV